MAALAVLLCTMALCNQVFAAPCKSTPLQRESPLSGLGQTIAVFCGFRVYKRKETHLFFFFKILVFFLCGVGMSNLLKVPTTWSHSEGVGVMYFPASPSMPKEICLWDALRHAPGVLFAHFIGSEKAVERDME